MVHSLNRRLCDFSTPLEKQNKTKNTKKPNSLERDQSCKAHIYPCVLPSPQTRVRQVVRKSLLVNVFVFVLYFLRRFTTCHFSGEPVCTDGVRVNLHFPSGAQRWYLFSLTRPLQALHQGVSKLSSCYFLLRVWKEMARLKPSLLFAWQSVRLTPVSWGISTLCYKQERKTKQSGAKSTEEKIEMKSQEEGKQEKKSKTRWKQLVL